MNMDLYALTMFFNIYVFFNLHERVDNGFQVLRRHRRHISMKLVRTNMRPPAATILQQSG